MADPNVEIVFHDADYDLRLLDLEYGFRANNLFDTRIAAQLLNEPGVGLAALLEKYLGVRLDKRYPAGRLVGAAALARDAGVCGGRHPPPSGAPGPAPGAAAGQRDGWSGRRRSLRLATGARWSPPDMDEPAYLRIKGAKALPGRSLAVLRELFTWRDQLARRTDKAAFRILNNEPMLAMAKTPPPDLAELKAVRGIGGEQAERRGREILAAVQRGLAVPEADLPRVERPPRRPPDPAYEARLERLKAAGTCSPLQYDLAPGVLCPNGTLEAIARLNPATMEQLARGAGAAALAAARDRRADFSRPFSAPPPGRPELRTRGRSGRGGPSSPASSRDPRPARPRPTARLPYPHHPLDIGDDFGSCRAAGRGERHLHLDVSCLIHLDFVYQPDIDDVEVELRILDRADGFADGFGCGCGRHGDARGSKGNCDW